MQQRQARAAIAHQAPALSVPCRRRRGRERRLLLVWCHSSGGGGGGGGGSEGGGGCCHSPCAPLAVCMGSVPRPLLLLLLPRTAMQGERKLNCMFATSLLLFLAGSCRVA